MKMLAPLALTLLCLLSCSDRKAELAIIPKAEEIFTCAESNEADMGKAMESAKKEIINKIYDVCSSNYEKHTDKENSKGVIGFNTTHITSDYACKSEEQLYSALVKQTEILKNPDGSIAFVKFCIKNSDAAKPYLDKQRKLAEDMEMAVATDKNEAWDKVQDYWNEFMGIQIRIEGLGVESKYFDKAKRSYEKAADEYREQRNAKLHWNPEKQTAYSDIAFSKLSESIQMETSPCTGKGISLVYSGAKPDCKSRGGPYACTYQPSLQIASCNGTKIRLLESPEQIKSFDSKEETAEKKLQEKLRTENFWKEWEQEIKQRSPQ